MTTLPQVKAISIDQPMPTAIILGLKGWETRTGPPAGDMCPDGVRPTPGHSLNRGDRVLLHATRRVPWKAQPVLYGDRFVVRSEFPEDDGPRYHLSSTRLAAHDLDDLPLGAVVGSAEIANVVPIVDYHSKRRHRNIIAEFPHEGDLPHQRGGLWVIGPDYHGDERYIEHQRPWGDWTPGRWAWRLDAVVPITRMCTRCAQPVTSDRPRPGWVHCNPPGLCVAKPEPFDGPVPVRGKQGVWMT